MGDVERTGEPLQRLTRDHRLADVFVQHAGRDAERVDAIDPHSAGPVLDRRGSGELIGRWPEDANGANRDQVMSGVLSAINAFASEALGADGHAMRHIDLGANRFYLRDSQTLLLAAKCSGSAPAAWTLFRRF